MAIQAANKAVLSILKQRHTEPGWLITLKKEALERFNSMEWPAQADPQWKKTPVSLIGPEKFSSEGEPVCQETKPTKSHKGYTTVFAVNDAGSAFKNGLYADKIGFYNLADYQAVPEHIQKLARESVEKHFRLPGNRFDALHNSRLSSIIIAVIPANAELKEPVLIHFQTDQAAVSAPHIVLIAENNSHAAVDILIENSGKMKRLISGVTDTVVGAGATLRLSLIVKENAKDRALMRNYASVEAEGHLYFFEGLASGKLLKSKTTVNLEDIRAKADITGFALAEKDVIIDFHTEQNHNAPACYSRALYKCAAMPGGLTSHQGTIVVAEGARLTDAYLSNKNLLLGTGARAYSIPKLLIKNNDVRCSHGSTTGKVNEQQLFYFASRGFTRSEALNLLTSAFFEELFTALSAPMKKLLSKKVTRTLTTRVLKEA